MSSLVTVLPSFYIKNVTLKCIFSHSNQIQTLTFWSLILIILLLDDLNPTSKILSSVCCQGYRMKCVWIFIKSTSSSLCCLIFKPTTYLLSLSNSISLFICSRSYRLGAKQGGISRDFTCTVCP